MIILLIGLVLVLRWLIGNWETVPKVRICVGFLWTQSYVLNVASRSKRIKVAIIWLADWWIASMNSAGCAWDHGPITELKLEDFTNATNLMKWAQMYLFLYYLWILHIFLEKFWFWLYFIYKFLIPFDIFKSMTFRTLILNFNRKKQKVAGKLIKKNRCWKNSSFISIVSTTTARQRRRPRRHSKVLTWPIKSCTTKWNMTPPNYNFW